jgi:hypothetical protein
MHLSRYFHLAVDCPGLRRGRPWPQIIDQPQDLSEQVYFEGDRICRLEDRYEPKMVQGIADYFKEHGEKLGISTIG